MSELNYGGLKMENESIIEIRHNGACVKITRKEGRCYYSTSGQPTRQLIKAVEYLEQVRADLPTASKMLIGEMFK